MDNSGDPSEVKGETKDDGGHQAMSDVDDSGESAKRLKTTTAAVIANTSKTTTTTTPNKITTTTKTPTQSPSLERTNSKGAVQKRIKELMQRYLHRMQKGCNRFDCNREFCASCPANIDDDEKMTDSKQHNKQLVQQALKKALEHVKKKLSDDIFCVPVKPLTLGELKRLAEESKEEDHKAVTHRIGPFFADRDAIAASFFKQSAEHKRQAPTSTNPSFDYEEWMRVYEFITEECPQSVDAFQFNLSQLANSMARKNYKSQDLSLYTLRAYAMVLEIRFFMMPEGQTTFMKICKGICNLSANSRQTLAKWLSMYSLERLENILGIFQQFITVRWFTAAHVDENMGHVAKTMNILYDANAMKAEKGEDVLDYKSFYNDAINEEMKVRDDFIRWRENDFSFCLTPFILDPAAKARVLQIDSKVQMQMRYREAVLSSFLQPFQQSPYLILHINRNNIIEDTLQQVQMVSRDDFKKPLKIKFEGEQGIDEGGVQKEFFQLLIAELFDANFGMFLYDEETHTYWFNKDSLESSMQFELIGQLLGLAIYNGVILDIHFPSVVYKKLMGGKLTLEDLCITRPELGRGLKTLLNFDGDVESTYCRNFSVSYDVYGETKVTELKEGGEKISLNNDNKEEYVELYVKHLLQNAIEKQYMAFERGFREVCDGEPLNMFRWEELELLICGSPELDFEALEASARYEDGFTGENDTIKHFWSVVHEMDLENKKKLLCFTTGSDRVPIKGLGTLNFTISKNGPDSDRLPTSHTCFNHLLLPDYSDREKLKRLLLLAIENSKGFGLM